MPLQSSTRSVWYAVLALACSPAPAPNQARPAAATRASSPTPVAVAPAPSTALTVQPAASGEQRSPVRDPEAALARANEGDQLIRLSVAGAIEKYQQAIELDPDNALLYWKLSAAFARLDDQARRAQSLQAAIERDPQQSRYWQWLAFARARLAEAGDATQWPLALLAAQRCVDLEPAVAECEHHAALASGATGQLEQAFTHHRTALTLEPTNARYHLAYVSLLVAQKRHREARTAIEAARKDADKLQRVREELYRLELLSHRLAQLTGDSKESLTSLEAAEAFAGEEHPELAFELGKGYAATKPPRTDHAQRLLQTFVKRVCLGAASAKFESECREARRLLRGAAGSNR